MSILRLRTLSLVCAAVFVFGVASYTVFSFQQSQKGRIEPARAFTLVLVESDVDPSGVETFKAIRTQNVDANGDWNEAVHPIGKVGHAQYSRTADGVSVSNGKQSFTIPQEPRPTAVREKTRTIGFYETSRAFVGTDTVAGLKVYRLRSKFDNEQEGWLETSYSPTTGIMPLRTIIHRPDGSEKRIETFRVTFQ